MKRRDLLKNISLGTAGVAISTSAFGDAPKPKEVIPEAANGKYKDEILYDKKLMSEVFFNKHEMATITVLTNIIISADSRSGNAADAKVPEFIEFMAKDDTSLQLPLRGGLMWLDSESKKQKGRRFIELLSNERIQLIDQIAYPEEAKPSMSQGVTFFNLMRDLTVTGFFTSEIGVRDLDYKGNVPNVWEGVPQDILKEYNVSYTDWEKHIKK
jgi:gluconate 2-dehydrogenase gamma chain